MIVTFSSPIANYPIVNYLTEELSLYLKMSIFVLNYDIKDKKKNISRYLSHETDHVFCL